MIFRLGCAYLASQVMTRFSAFMVAQGVPMLARYSIFAACGFLVLVTCMWIWQESLLYIPSVPNPANPLGNALRRPADGPEGLRSPAERGIPFEDVALVGADGVKAAAWFMPAGDAEERARAPTILFSHENAGSMALRMPLFEALRVGLRCNIMCYDYRGYGDSDDAVIGEDGLMLDAHAAWRWLTQQAGIDTSKILIFGASLGGAVSIQLARDVCEAVDAGSDAGPKPLGVVVLNTFTCIADMMSAKYPFLDFGIVKRHMLRMRWHSIDHVAKLTVPLLLVVGLQDEIVPSIHTQLLAKAAVNSPMVTSRNVPNGTHNDTWAKAGAQFVMWLAEFIRDAQAARGKADGTKKER